MRLEIPAPMAPSRALGICVSHLQLSLRVPCPPMSRYTRERLPKRERWRTGAHGHEKESCALLCRQKDTRRALSPNTRRCNLQRTWPGCVLQSSARSPCPPLFAEAHPNTPRAPHQSDNPKMLEECGKGYHLTQTRRLCWYTYTVGIRGN